MSSIKEGVKSIPVKGVKTESVVTQSLLREATQKKIAYLLSKHSIKDVEVYVIIKDFFKEYLHANYEFTFDELAKELNKTYIEKHIKEALHRLLEDFSTIEYKDEDIPDDVVKDILRTFSKLVDDLIAHQSIKKTSFFSRLFSKKEKKVKVPKEEVPKKVEPKREPKVEEEPVQEKVKPVIEKKEEIKEPVQEEKEHNVTSNNFIEDMPAVEREVKTSVKDGFEVPEFSQELPTSFEDEQKSKEDSVKEMPAQEEQAQEKIIQEEHAFNQDENIVQEHPVEKKEEVPMDNGFDHEEISHETTTISSGSWDENVEPVKAEDSVEDDFPFASENEALDKMNKKYAGTTVKKEVKGEEQSVQQEKSVEEVTPQEIPVQEEEPLIKETSSQEVMSDETNNLQEKAIEDMPTPIQESPKQESYEEILNPDEAEISSDLNKLVEELDEVIKEDVHAAPTAVAEADGMTKLISETERLIVEKRLPEAQNVYKELVGLYHELSDEEKHVYYEKVQHLYDLLQ